MEPSGDPSNLEDWSVWRNFHEAARLMTTRFHVFLPSLVYNLFPGSLMSVVYFQFVTDSSFPRSALGSILNTVISMVPIDLVDRASVKVFHAMKTTVYVLDDDKYRSRDPEQVLPDLLTCWRDNYGGRRPRALAVGVVCVLVYSLCFVAPMGFGFEDVAAVGMPEWTAVLFTPLLAVGTSLLNLYILVVVNLVLGMWVFAAQPVSAILT